MQMTDAELLHSYNRADDKIAQVKILADLNGMRHLAMREHLLTLGIPEDEMIKRRASKVAPVKKEPVIGDGWKRTDVDLPVEDGYYFVVVCALRGGVPSEPKLQTMLFKDEAFVLDDLCVVTHWCKAPAMPAELEGKC